MLPVLPESVLPVPLPVPALPEAVPPATLPVLPEAVPPAALPVLPEEVLPVPLPVLPEEPSEPDIIEESPETSSLAAPPEAVEETLPLPESQLTSKAASSKTTAKTEITFFICFTPIGCWRSAKNLPGAMRIRHSDKSPEDGAQ